MKTIVSTTRTHTLVGFANPFFHCVECDVRVPYWHNPEHCGTSGNCDAGYYNSPCGHKADIVSKCSTWSPVDGCMCETPCKK
jgi:hypothetical protein